MTIIIIIAKKSNIRFIYNNKTLGSLIRNVDLKKSKCFLLNIFMIQLKTVEYVAIITYNILNMPSKTSEVLVSE